MSKERRDRKIEREKARFEAMVQEELRRRQLFKPRQIAAEVRALFSRRRTWA
ncbi:MAG: hypothetical protein U1A72_09705 [Sulfuritalea sp.]|nr:hypothetical protein [Hyphomicrobiales bacterium]MDZ4252829.1 hypothetical protein [Sulfuritalea sp.]